MRPTGFVEQNDNSSVPFRQYDYAAEASSTAKSYTRSSGQCRAVDESYPYGWVQNAYDVKDCKSVCDNDPGCIAFDFKGSRCETYGGLQTKRSSWSQHQPGRTEDIVYTGTACHRCEGYACAVRTDWYTPPPSITHDERTYQKFWWFKAGSAWPPGKTDVLGDEHGSCEASASVCLQRMPAGMEEDSARLIAIDSVGNQFEWAFSSSNKVAHAAWLAFTLGKTTAHVSGESWDPKVIHGVKFERGQDNFMYRDQDGIRSLLLDDDGCDCHSTLSMGHAMCKEGCSAMYGNCRIKGGVDKLSDKIDTGTKGSGSKCTGPATDYGLSLYYYPPITTTTTTTTTSMAAFRSCASSVGIHMSMLAAMSFGM